ncbi:hypothetical protein WJX81_002481 [Elliptochloris bilobata]|uniref:Cytochrome b561 domain-containing protein n=1 Tax=Elliptochloris bilobata TaxID=381761 RepID=A0AAW1QJY2_9CHLO
MRSTALRAALAAAALLCLAACCAGSVTPEQDAAAALAAPATHRSQGFKAKTLPKIGQLRMPGQGAYARALLQASCGLQFGARVERFAGCSDLSANVSTGYSLLYTLTDNGNGTSTLSGAMERPATAPAWIAFGLPACPDCGMTKGSAVVAKTNASSPTGASVEPYYLGSYSVAKVRPGGNLTLLHASAAQAGGRLQATFRLLLKGSTAALAAQPLPVLSAASSLSETGELIPHRASQAYDWALDLSGAVAAPSPAAAALAAAAAPAPAHGPAPRRRLLHAPCTLRVGSEALGFAACQDLSANLADGYNLLYTLADNGNGTSVLSGAFDRPAAGPAWAAFGLPPCQQDSCGMLHGSAVIARTCADCSTGASVDHFYLGAYSPSAIQAPGRLAVLGMSAAQSGGRLQGTFRLLLANTSAELAAAPLSVLTAGAGLTPTGELVPHHANQGYLFGLDLKSAAAAPAPGGAEAAPAPLPADAAAPAPTSSAAADAAPSLGPPRRLLRVVEQCNLQVGPQSIRFAACRDLSANISTGYNLLYTLTDNGNGTSVLSAAMDRPATDLSWLAFGLPACPTCGMLNGSAIIARDCPDCHTGAAIDTFLLGGYSVRAIRPPGRLHVLGMSAVASYGRLQATFQLLLPGSAAQLAAQGLPVLAAAANLDDSLNLVPHTTAQGVATVLDMSNAIAVAAKSAPEQPSNAQAAAGAPALLPAPRLFRRQLQAAAPRRRTLLLAPRRLAQAACGLQVGGQTQRFAACQDLSANVSTGYSLLYTLTDNGNGTSTLSGAMERPVTAPAWVAFGLAACPTCGMPKASAVIAKTDAASPTGASVRTYYLGGYRSALVVPGGNLTLLHASAAQAGSRLQATFRLLLAGVAAAHAATPLPVLVAGSALDASGGLQPHAADEAQDFALALGNALGAAPAPAPSATQRSTLASPISAPQPSPAAAAAQPPAARVSAQGAVPVTSLGSERVAPMGVPPGAQPAQSCAVTFGGGANTTHFSSCRALTIDSSALAFFWSLEPDAQGQGSQVRGALQCAHDGWCAWGLPEVPDRMVGGSAVIVKPCATCPSGAAADNYYMGGQSPAAVVAGAGRLNVSGLAAARDGSGRLQAMFSLRLPQAPDQLTALPFLASLGPVASDGTLQAHPGAYSLSGTCDMVAGSLSVASEDLRIPRAHGIVMAVAWVALLPISVVVAHLCRHFDPASARGIKAAPTPFGFQIHRALGLTAFAAMLAGLGLGVWWWQRMDQSDAVLRAHVGLGSAVTALAVLQVAAVVLRPKPDARRRGVWNQYHWWTGRVALTAAFVNVVLGIAVAGEARFWIWVFVRRTPVRPRAVPRGDTFLESGPDAQSFPKQPGEEAPFD